MASPISEIWPPPLCSASKGEPHEPVQQDGEQWSWIKCKVCGTTLAYWPREFNPSDIARERRA